MIWACVIQNSICVICCTALAIVFDKWWLILFSILFLSSIVQKPYYYRFCDKCGKRSESASTYDGALEKAKKAGWVHYVDGNRDYCPDCKE